MAMKLTTALAAATVLVAGWAAGSLPAAAAPVAKTLNVAQLLPLGQLDIYYGAYPQTAFMSDMIYDSLVAYDRETKKIVPLLAKSWKQTADAIEFQLRDDVTFSDGVKMTADDVVYTLNWLVDPKSRFRDKQRWSWIKKAVKEGPYTVKVETKAERPANLLLLTAAPIYPEHVRAKLANITDFGRNPVGTGPYKIEDFNIAANRLVLVKNKAYHWGGKTKPVTNIDRVEVRTIPDQGAQVAGLMVGKINLVRDLPTDQAEALAKDPRFGLDINPNIGITYMWFDAAGRAGNKALTNPKVRRALAMAVNPKVLSKIMFGTRKPEIPQNLCWPDRVAGCAFTHTAPTYDPAAAKKLLAEAGYPNGFSLKITSYVGRLTDLAQAVAGYLAAIGVKATVEPVTVGTWTRKARAGEIQMTVAGNSLSGLPDTSQFVSFFLHANDYTHDPELTKLGNEMDAEMDAEKRQQIATKFFNRIVDNTYLMPMTSMPEMFIHTSDVEVTSFSSNTYGLSVNDLRWKEAK
jgi:peptide/nickel transport system substrate-binding protein